MAGEGAYLALDAVHVARECAREDDAGIIAQLYGTVGACGNFMNEQVVIAIHHVEGGGKSFVLEKEVAAVNKVGAGATVGAVGYGSWKPSHGIPQAVEISQFCAPHLVVVRRVWFIYIGGKSNDEFLAHSGMAHHVFEPKRRRDAACTFGERHERMTGSLDAEGDTELAAREAARVLGHIGHIEIGMGELERTHDVGGGGGFFIVDHDYLKGSRIILMEDGRQESGKVAAVATGEHYHAYCRKCLIGRHGRGIVGSCLTPNPSCAPCPDENKQQNASHRNAGERPCKRGKIYRVIYRVNHSAAKLQN